MIIRPFFQALFLCLMLSSIEGAIVKDPQYDFVVSHETLDESYLPKTDEIYRLTLDVNGTRKPVVFLSYRRWGSKSGNLWVVYVPTEGGYTRFDGTLDGNTIMFRTDGFTRAGPVPGYSREGGLYVLYPGKGGGNLVHYLFSSHGVSVRPIRSIDYSRPKDMRFASKILGHEVGAKDSFDEFSPETLSAIAIRNNGAGH
jgi:hypothetical protein